MRNTVGLFVLLIAVLPASAQTMFSSYGNCSENMYGFVNINNKTRNIPPVYCLVNRFSEGLAAVKKGGKWGYIDTNNNEVIGFDFDYAQNFKLGQAVVQKGDFYGVVDKKGNYVVQPMYYLLDPLEIAGQLYYLSRDASFFQGVIDHKGKVILPHQFTFILPLDDYENIPFYSSYQEVDTSETSFFQQFADNMYKFDPQKGRHDIYDTQFNKLASKISADYTDGFDYYQLHRIDQFLEENGNKNVEEKIKQIDKLLALPKPQDTIMPGTQRLEPLTTNEEKLDEHLEKLSYKLFTNAEGERWLEKGGNIIIPAQYKYLEIMKGTVALAAKYDVSYMQENYGGNYRKDEEGIFDIFCIMASNNTTAEMHLFDLNGQKILSLTKQKGLAETGLVRITPVGFKYTQVVKGSSDQVTVTRGLINWKGAELLAPVYQNICVMKTGELLVEQEKGFENGIEKHFGLYSKTGVEIIPMGEYSNIKAFPETAHLYLATSSDPYPTVKENKELEQGNKSYTILKTIDDSYTVVNTFTASSVSRWAVDTESGMLQYRQDKTDKLGN